MAGTGTADGEGGGRIEKIGIFERHSRSIGCNSRRTETSTTVEAALLIEFISPIADLDSPLSHASATNGSETMPLFSIFLLPVRHRTNFHIRIAPSILICSHLTIAFHKIVFVYKKPEFGQRVNMQSMGRHFPTLTSFIPTPEARA